MQAQHWYFITYRECPICGREIQERERRYGPRPEHYEDRREFVVHYDYCDQ